VKKYFIAASLLLLISCGDHSGGVDVETKDQSIIDIENQIKTGQISTTSPQGTTLVLKYNTDSVVFHVMPDSTFTETIYTGQ
jgi:hypothetical protein